MTGGAVGKTGEAGESTGLNSSFAQRGGLGRAHQLFGAQLPALLDEHNAALAA